MKTFIFIASIIVLAGSMVASLASAGSVRTNVENYVLSQNGIVVERAPAVLKVEKETLKTRIESYLERNAKVK